MRYAAVMRLSFLLLTAVLLTSSLAAGQQKIAFVDMRRALASTADGQRISATLKRDFDRIQVELARSQSEFTKAREDLQKQRAALGAEQFANKMATLQSQAAATQQQLRDDQVALGRREEELSRPVKATLNRLLADLAKEGGYQVVLDASAAHLVDPSLDLTDRLVALANSNGKR